MSAYTPHASLSVGGYRGFAAILLTDTAAQLCAAFFDRPGYPAPRCTFRPAFTLSKSFKEPDDLDRWAEFHAGVESLPEELREVANLLYYEGLSQDEASEVLGISIRTLKRRWHDTKQRLHRVLRDEPG
jgi:predicted DNA-binding protein (UPF0251 family)